MNFLADKAEIFEEVQPLREYTYAGNKVRYSSKTNGDKSSDGSSTIPPRKSASFEKSNATEEGREKILLLFCLNLSYSYNYLVRDCSKTTNDQGNMLLDEYCEKKLSKDQDFQVSTVRRSTTSVTPKKSTKDDTTVKKCQMLETCTVYFG